MRFCDYCACEECKTGSKYLKHAKTDKGNWICDVCYRYDLCTATNNAPCEDENKNVIPDCPHRPKLISDWIDYHPLPSQCTPPRAADEDFCIVCMTGLPCNCTKEG